MQIVLLQKELEGQTVVRSALEKALNHRPLLDDSTYKSLSQVSHFVLGFLSKTGLGQCCALCISSALDLFLQDFGYINLSRFGMQIQPAENLIKEITLLELEVVYLEKYLLSMYRTSFAKRLSPLPKSETRPKTDAAAPSLRSVEVAKSSLESVSEDSVIRVGDDPSNALPLKCNELLGLDDTGIYRSHSSLSHSACSFRASPPYGAVAEALDSYHSLPLSMLEVAPIFFPQHFFKHSKMA